MTRETLYQRTARHARENQQACEAMAGFVRQETAMTADPRQPVFLDAAELELAATALGLLLSPAAAALQARLRRLQP